MNRIILSRKGFDSKFGGKPSPIFRDKRIFSIPIPQEEPAPHRYKDVKYNNEKNGNICEKEVIISKNISG